MIIKRELSQAIKKLAGVYPIISLTGPRQSGKTTLVKTLFPNYDYINLENPDDRAFAEEDPRRLLNQNKKKGLIIDEAQRVPHIFSYLQEVADNAKQMGKFIITGSQNFLLLEKITQSLAGRVALFNLLPLSLKESLKSGNKYALLDHHLFNGFYPVLFDRAIAPENYYPNYIQTYLERDVRSIINVSNLSLFQRFLKSCAGRTGQLINLSSLGNDLGISYKTVRDWIAVLEASFIVYLLFPYHKNFNKRIVKQPKLYFYDTGLLCSLLQITSREQLAHHYLRGSIFESFVITEQIKKSYNRGELPIYYFWRDSTGHEIDLIIEKGLQQYPVEIKSGETLKPDFFKGLKYYQKISGVKPDNCYLVYGGTKKISTQAAQAISWKKTDSMP